LAVIDCAMIGAQTPRYGHANRIRSITGVGTLSLTRASRRSDAGAGTKDSMPWSGIFAGRARQA